MDVLTLVLRYGNQERDNVAGRAIYRGGESIERKEEFRKLDQERPREKCPQLIEIEEEAKRRAKYVLERAENMRLEQEEEIQKCNRIILETKCRAIRDAQVKLIILFKKIDKKVQ